MRAAQDEHLDRTIKAQLRPTPLSAARKQHAWEAVRARAATQVQLAPLVAAVPAPNGWMRLLRTIDQFMYYILYEETRYDRARSTTHRPQNFRRPSFADCNLLYGPAFAVRILL
jgi:hypothetical protein